MGLSMGGTLTLRLAEQHQDAVAGIVLVNPSVQSENKALVALPLLKHVIPSLAGVPTTSPSPARTRWPTTGCRSRRSSSLTALWALTKADLGQVTCPVLLFRSPQDHVVEPSNAGVRARPRRVDRDRGAAPPQQLPRGHARQRRAGDPRGRLGLRPAAQRARARLRTDGARQRPSRPGVDPCRRPRPPRGRRGPGRAADGRGRGLRRPRTPGTAGPYLDVQLPDRPTDRLYVEAGARERAAAVLADLRPRGRARRARRPGRPTRTQSPPTWTRRSPRSSPGSTGTAPRSRFRRRQDAADDPTTGHAERAADPRRRTGGTTSSPTPVRPGRPRARRTRRRATCRRPRRRTPRRRRCAGSPGPRCSARRSWSSLRAVLLRAGRLGRLLVVGAFVGGLVTLVVTLEDRPADDDGPDNGAVV